MAPAPFKPKLKTPKVFSYCLTKGVGGNLKTWIFPGHEPMTVKIQTFAKSEMSKQSVE